MGKLNNCNYLDPKAKLISKRNVLLVQTLYFTNQERTEAITTELLVGLNYIWKKFYWGVLVVKSLMNIWA